MSTVSTCVNDKPISDSRKDFLKNETYSKGLLKFITNAETPITIGIQGGWGSGKTSLINLLREGLCSIEKLGEAPPISVVVNAWEYSLFTSDSNDGEVVGNLLSGLLSEIDQKIVELGTDRTAAGLPQVPPQIIAKARDKDFGLQRAIAISKSVGLVGMQLAALIRGGNVPADAKLGMVAPAIPASLASIGRVRELRESLNRAVHVITNETEYKRFVFFIDDLDRVQPKTAVGILDAFKNIFEIDNCVFVLAIDFEVVVKGLESKFGKEKQGNEREFRQYFDKIIQVPFTMPVGSYSKHLGNLIRNNINLLGLDPDEKWVIKDLVDVALLSTEGVPRSIKRIINSMSLMLRIHEEIRGADRSRSSLKFTKGNEEIFLKLVFIIVAIHINFPEICRCLMLDHNFAKWNMNNCRNLFGLTEDDLSKLSTHDDGSESEAWKKVLACVCSKIGWVKDRAVSVLKIFLALSAVLQTEDSEITEQNFELLSEALDLVRVVSFDLDESRNIDESDVTNDTITHFMRKIHQVLMTKVEWVGLKKPGESCYAASPVKRTRTYYLTASELVSPFKEMCFEWYEKTNGFSICVQVKSAGKGNFSENQTKQVEQEAQKRLSSYSFSSSSKPIVEFASDGWLYFTFTDMPNKNLLLQEFNKLEARLIPSMISALELSRDVFKDLVALVK
ncbi:MAG: KAP family NTPase [Deltaproteobacteria bacterium]|jgi:hypothetical protein|nr:KAP family NTPase [Deltaproteobacteria bacterium]